MALLQMDWKPSKQALRRFGLSFSASALVFAALLWWVGDRPTLAAALGGGLFLAGLVIAVTPASVARPIYLAIMVPTFLVGSVVSRVLVGVLFFAVVTPIGLALRFRRKDPLALHPTSGSKFTTSNAPEATSEAYERPF